MSIGDVYRITMQWTMPQTTVAQWVFHIIQSTAGAPDNDTLLDDIETKLATDFATIANRISSGVLADQISLALYDSGLGEFNTVASKAATISLNGTNVNPVDSHQLSGLVKFFTAVAKSIGKKFIHGLSQGSFVDSLLLSAVQTDLLTWGTAFAGQYSSQGIDFTPGNWVRKTGGFREWTGDVGVNSLESSTDSRRPGFGI